MEQDLARHRSRFLAILEGGLAVHHYPAVSLRLLHSAPIAAGKVVYHLCGGGPQLLEVVHHYIRRRTLSDKSPVLDSTHEGGKVAQLVVGLFQAQHSRVTGEPRYSLRREVAQNAELDVGPTVGYAGDGIAGVSLNLASGIQEATEHLIGLGHERICFLGEDWTGADGLRSIGNGYRDTMRRHGLTPSVSPVEAARARSGYNLGKALRDRFTAFACCCDYTALGVCRGLIESGVRVPDDVAVTGFGDYEVSSYVSPSLTTLTIPYEDVAATAVRGILRQLKGQSDPGRSVFKPRLTVRESCGAG